MTEACQSPALRSSPTAHKSDILKPALTTLAVITIIAAMAFVFRDQFTLHDLKLHIADLATWKAAAPILFTALFFAGYVAATTLCIPLEIPFALAAGALFGLGTGVLISSFASIFGATLAFLAARYLLRDALHRHFAGHVDTINRGVESDGAFYLFSLRLMPILPFSILNVVMGLTSIRLGVFFVTSQVAMIFATLVFVNAGTQIAAIQSYGDIVSPSMMLGLLALGALPWLGKGLVKTVRRMAPLAVGTNAA